MEGGAKQLGRKSESELFTGDTSELQSFTRNGFGGETNGVWA